MSDGYFINPSFQNFFKFFPPRPSILKASLETKYSNEPNCWSSHFDNPPVHLIATSFSFLYVFDLQHGQTDGIRNFLDFLVLLFISTDITCGITSPARWSFIVSPILISFLFISSWLCSETLDTFTPPTKTGSNSATGVKIPVRPTCIVIFFIRVSAFSAGNFLAIAQRGALPTRPNLFWILTLFIL